MIKDSRYIIKRVIIGVLISLILTFIYSCDVKAETLTSSATINYSYTGTDTAQVIYQGSGYWANQGQGQLEFTMIVYKESSNTSFSLPLISGIVARSDNNTPYECTYGSIDLEYNQSSDNMKGYIVPVICNMSMGSSGLTRIGVTFTGATNSWTTQTSSIFTFTRDGSAIISDRVSYIFSYLQDWVYPRLQDIITSTTSTRDYLSYIYQYLQNYIYIRMGALESAITNNQIQQHNDSIAEIEAGNQNTQEQIESQQVCQFIDKNNIDIEQSYLKNDGSVYNESSSWGITKYIKINKNTKIKVITETYGTNPSYCFYNTNKTLISCYNNSTLSQNNYITLPNNISFIRFSINGNQNKPQFEICNNGNQATNDSINEVNDTLNNSDVDDPSSSLTDMENKIVTNSVISDLLLLPITLFQNVLNSINGTCSTFNLGSLLGTNLSLPCINLSNILGSALYGVIDILLCGIFILSMRKRFVDIFENITSLKDRGNELE